MLRVGVIGCGAISVIHFDAILKNQDAQLVSVCDINLEVLDKTTSKYSCNGYVDYSEMISSESLDVVHICTPHYLHKEMIVKAIGLNINVVTEKPVVMNMLEAQEVECALANSEAKLAVSFQNRYNPTSVVMREYVDNEVLGQLVGIKGFVTWQREPESYYANSEWRGKYATEGGSLVINQAIHTIDLIQWLGGELTKVDGSYSTKAFQEYIETDDTAEIYFEFSNGAKGLFYGTNAYSTNSPVEMELHFEKGLLKYMLGKLFLVDQEGELKELARDFLPGKTGKNYWGASHEKAINAFYQAFTAGGDYIDLVESITAIDIISQLKKAN
ncbi:Gfo/Idh/MocA family protein [Vibrio comitans]|uniref:Oxidoreductase n=1 Tax=Vibrio comitans NBRC 102076 TaxID=1219078 RepID=A0A4Y3IPX7_9VIBR|nr:Gfo/Idh/MocA family oxidoreductase [Vibrio comitans]GEA61182.1 oxidoreductase [Vibrio comitans NBRC 102076]